MSLFYDRFVVVDRQSRMPHQTLDNPIHAIVFRSS